MSEVKAKFNVQEFEDYGTNGTVNDLYLSEEQLSKVLQTKVRVNEQLDWLAQLLGWNGDFYWGNLVSSVSQKRNTLTGTFGFYNGFLYPRVLEIRNWENSVVIEADERLSGTREYYLGDYTYEVKNLTVSDQTYTLTFEELGDQFYADISANKQLKAVCPGAQSAPFSRPEPRTSGDSSFLCDVQGNSIVLFPSYNTEKSLPYRYNCLLSGGRYYFDKPVTLQINGFSPLEPLYDFSTERWYLDIPQNSSELNVGSSALLSLGTASLEVSLFEWKDPSDWNNKNTIENFRGVWNNKGGRLPFNFVLDSLGIHGFDEKKSVFLAPFERQISFDSLLDFVYYQRARVAPNPPNERGRNQVWWNTVNNELYVYENDPLNCGPWVEIDYPTPPTPSLQADLTFSNLPAFLAYTDPIDEGAVVQIEDITGINPVSFNLLGLTQTLSGPGRILFFQGDGEDFWTPAQFIFETLADFEANAEELPVKVPVYLLDSSGLSPTGPTFRVSNLSFTITESLPTRLMKDTGAGNWYISPPSELKYIGNTRLFESSLNWASPVDGEMNWDYTEVDPNLRSARMFYYNSWAYDTLLSEWVPQGEWVDVNSQTTLAAIPNVVNFGAIHVYCDGTLLPAGGQYRTENYQLSFDFNSLDGTFVFYYEPITYTGLVDFPKVVISDSLTSTFSHDISNLVFSGLTYYMSPNVLDSETLLRVWKAENLHVVDSLSRLELLRNKNPLRADINSGPGDENWERYFLRLPPAYGRNEAVWQKVNLVCQNFGYWGSSINPETMSCPPEKTTPRLYEEVHATGGKVNLPVYLYAEPYLYSAAIATVEPSSDYDNSAVLPSYDQPYDDFSEAEVISYDPLHCRLADTTSPIGRGYGEWEGEYFRAEPCVEFSGFANADLVNGILEPILPPAWDASIYKLPLNCGGQQASSTVDSNHYKVGYAFFAADLSAAEEGFFDFS